KEHRLPLGALAVDLPDDRVVVVHDAVEGNLQLLIAVEDGLLFAPEPGNPDTGRDEIRDDHEPRKIAFQLECIHCRWWRSGRCEKGLPACERSLLHAACGSTPSS